MRYVTTGFPDSRIPGFLCDATTRRVDAAGGHGDAAGGALDGVGRGCGRGGAQRAGRLFDGGEFGVYDEAGQAGDGGVVG